MSENQNHETMKVYVTMGIPGSGKSYFVSHTLEQQREEAQMFDHRWESSWSWVINPDLIRFHLTGDSADQSQNSKVFDLAHGRLKWLIVNEWEVAADLSGSTYLRWPIIFDATNVKRFARKNILDICEEYGAEPHLIVFDTPFEKCMERVKRRTDLKQALENKSERRWTHPNRIVVVPDHAMERMYGEFQQALEDIKSEPWASITNGEVRVVPLEQGDSDGRCETFVSPYIERRRIATNV